MISEAQKVCQCTVFPWFDSLNASLFFFRPVLWRTVKWQKTTCTPVWVILCGLTLRTLFLGCWTRVLAQHTTVSFSSCFYRSWQNGRNVSTHVGAKVMLLMEREWKERIIFPTNDIHCTAYMWTAHVVWDCRPLSNFVGRCHREMRSQWYSCKKCILLKKLFPPA